MNRLYTFKSIVVSLFAVALVFVAAPHATAQTKETASFTIAGGTYTAEGTFPVTVYEDSGSTEVTAMVLDLQYDAAKLALVEAGSAPSGLMNFPTPPEVTPGAVLIPRTSSSFSSMKGKQTFAVLHFRALVNTGTTAVTIGPRSEIYSTLSAENIWDGNALGATINFAAAAPAPASQPERATSTQRATASPTRPKTTGQATTAQPAGTALSDANETSIHGPVTVSIIGSNEPSNDHAAIAVASLIAACLAALSGYSILFTRHQRRRQAHSHPHPRRHHAKSYHKTHHKKVRRKHA